MTATRLVFYSLLSVLLSGCDSPSSSTESPVPLLNSERIEQRFGSYDLTLLWQSDSLRVSNLYSTRDGLSTTRTLALVQFSPAATDPAIAAIHQQILAGSSIGATFKQAGWKVSKQRHRFSTHEVAGKTPDAIMIRDLMRLELHLPLAFHAYELRVDNGQRTLHYADLVELHHPDYLSLADLKAIYPTTSATGSSSGQASLDITTRLPALLQPAATDYLRLLP